MSKKKILFLILLVLIIGGLSGIILFENNKKVINSKIEEKQKLAKNVQYENEEFGFRLKHPENWPVQSTEKIVPMINIYNPDSIEEEPPTDITHHNQIENISVFPQGIPTEGLITIYKEINKEDINFKYGIEDNSRIYYLENGQPFAAYVIPKDKPDTWNESGYVWIRADVDNLQSKCIRNENEIRMESCDLLGSDDTIHYSGSVKKGSWENLLKSISSFEFIESLKEEETTKAEIEDLIIVDAPKPNTVIESPLEITGEARGNWFFEGDAQVTLTDWDGRIIAESYIQAEDEWMTEDFVPFSGTLEFEEPEDIGDFSDMGNIIFAKANPSGLPENAEFLEYRVKFR